MDGEIKTVSILGSGWLGLPLAEHFVSLGFRVKTSTTTEARLSELQRCKTTPFILDIDRLDHTIQEFLDSTILIINIPSKNIPGFQDLLYAIRQSTVQKVLFVSSTAVYKEINTTISESDGAESETHPLFIIENILQSCGTIDLTIVRLGGLVGYTRHPGRFFRNGRAISNAEARVNLIHRDDCIGIISQIVEQEVWGEVFNCCADSHPTRREFYTQAAISAGMAAPECENKGSSPCKIISNQKVKRDLQYTFVHADLMKTKF